MSGFTAKVVGSINLNNKTFYKIEVNQQSSGNAWIVYRRFSEFDALREKLFAILGEAKLETLQLTFPEKMPGSTLSFVVDKRINTLGEFLRRVLEMEEFADNTDIPTFMDVANKGVSGVQIQLGANKIAKESFARVKYNKPYLYPMTTNFVVLLKSGELYVLPSLYSNTSQAEYALKVSNNLIIPRAKNNIINLIDKTLQDKLTISLATPQESAFWIRALSDYSVSNTVASDTKTAHVAEKRKSAADAVAAKEHAKQNAIQEHIKANGSGNTTDELSAQYGI